jgi:hypothetical protein
MTWTMSEGTVGHQWSSSRLSGDDSMLNRNSTAYVGVSQLDGGASVLGGIQMTCFQVYDGDYQAYNCY